jgi:hypothetical protein
MLLQLREHKVKIRGQARPLKKGRPVLRKKGKKKKSVNKGRK